MCPPTSAASARPSGIPGGAGGGGDDRLAATGSWRAGHRARMVCDDERAAMARVVVLGAGISGHTAALHLQRRLRRRHEVIVVSPGSHWNWIPSNIWVGVGRMTPD